MPAVVAASIASNWARATGSSATIAPASFGTGFGPASPPPHPARASVETRRRRPARFIEKKAPSGRLPRAENSIDQAQSRLEIVLPEPHLGLRGRVDGGRDARPELAEL